MQMPMTHHGYWRNSQARDMFDRATHARMAAPWAALAMLGAFAGGALVGMFGGKKSAYSKFEHGSKMMKHHHHGSGTPMCTKKHKHEEHEEHREHEMMGGEQRSE